MWNWVFTRNSTMYWVFVVLNWVFVKQLFPYIFYTRPTFFYWVFIISFAFCYHGLKTIISEKELDKYPQTSLSVSL